MRELVVKRRQGKANYCSLEALPSSATTTTTMSHTHTMTMENHGGPNIRSQDVRYRRIGGEAPYRDDPVRTGIVVYNDVLLRSMLINSLVNVSNRSSWCIAPMNPDLFIHSFIPFIATHSML